MVLLSSRLRIVILTHSLASILLFRSAALNLIDVANLSGFSLDLIDILVVAPLATSLIRTLRRSITRLPLTLDITLYLSTLVIGSIIQRSLVPTITITKVDPTKAKF
jgi:surface polysaccharide O-acyltransferase-like enzyme